MAQVLTIFVAGIGGVFLGMTMLYISIRVTSYVTGRVVGKKGGK